MADTFSWNIHEVFKIKAKIKNKKCQKDLSFLEITVLWFLCLKF